MRPKKFVHAEVNPQPCPPEDAEKHLRAFAESFVDSKHSDRWVHLLVEKPEKAEKALHKFERQLNERCCKLIGRGADSCPRLLRRCLGLSEVSTSMAANLRVESLVGSGHSCVGALCRRNVFYGSGQAGRCSSSQ